MHPMPMQTHTRLRPPDGLRRRLRAAAGLLTDNRSMQQLILLRWIAVFGQLLVIGMIHVWAGISLPLHTMLSIAGGQALFNVFSVYYWRQHSDVSERALLLSFLTDVAALIFNTHGESMGRGAHPESMADRLSWPLSPWARRRT